MNFLEALKQEYANIAYTENNARAYKSTGNKLLDLFSRMSVSRSFLKKDKMGKKYLDDDILNLCLISFDESPILTLQAIIYARDILNGQGERDTSRQMLISLINSRCEGKVELFERTLVAFKELGRFDDLVCVYMSVEDNLIKNYIIQIIKAQLKTDTAAMIKGGVVSLLAKWLPSENTSSKQTKQAAKAIRKALNLDSAEYRKILTKLRAQIKIIENKLRTKDYSFDYESVPSQAMLKYTKAFKRNDLARFESYLDSLSKGESKVNVKTLTPANVIYKMVQDNGENKSLFNAQWKQMLENFECLNGVDAIVAADVSGSMYGGGECPIYVSVGLALFFAYKNTAKYKGHFIDFCGNSQIHELDLSKDLWVNYNLILNSSRDTNTNVDSVFKALLDSAVKHKISQKDLPKYLIIISDMEFDACSYDDNEVNFNSWKKRFKENAYELPIIVFWNAANRNNISPAQKNDSVIMLSGRSQNGFKTLNLIEKCGIIKPEELALKAMVETLKGYDRYFE